MTQATSRSLIGTVCIGLLLWLAFTVVRPDPHSGQPSTPLPLTSALVGAFEPDLRLGSATITEFDTAGKLKFQLFARQMSRFEATTETALEEPRLQIHPDDGAPWNVEAKVGKIRNETGADGVIENVVMLRDAVVLRQLDATTKDAILVIRTEAIDLFPVRQFAKSAASVMIDSDAGRTQAAGLEGSLKTGRLLLSSDAEQSVHTIVLPTQFKSSK